MSLPSRTISRGASSPSFMRRCQKPWRRLLLMRQPRIVYGPGAASRHTPALPVAAGPPPLARPPRPAPPPAPRPARGAAARDVEPRLAVLDHQAVRHDEAVGAPIGNAEAVAGAVAAEDLHAARWRPHVPLQLEEHPVGRVAVGDAVGDVRALDSFPAADPDPDAGAAGLLAAVEASAAHGVDPLEDAVAEMVAAQPGRGDVVDVEIAERGAHHVLEVEPLGARVVLVERHPRTVDLEVEKHAVRKMVLAACAVLQPGEAGQCDRGSVALQNETRRAFAGAGERDAAAPGRGRAGDAVRPGRAKDDARAAVRLARAAELVDQRGERRLIVRLAVAFQAVLAGVADPVFVHPRAVAIGAPGGPARPLGRELAAVGPGDDLEQVAARILEVDAASAVVAVDLPFLLLAGIRPVLEFARLDAAEDLIELPLAHEEGVVLRLDFHVLGVEESERHLDAEDT